MAEALYRKYRPQVFEDVVGQEPIERTLKNAIAQDKVSHAYLFCGPRGTGKTTTARLLAKALLCQNGPTPNPDGTCEDCQLIADGVHPDVYELDAASRTGVENVREEIISRVQFAPTRGRNKVYIIDEVHMLSTAAFNALLKTLEEPPSHVVFILCTTDPQKVPETIHSRCQRFDFHRIAPESMVSRLGAICMAESVEFEGEALDLIAQRAEGGLRNALTSLEQIIAFENGKVTLAGAERLLGAIDSNDMAEIMSYVGKRDIANCFRWTSAYVETGADLAQFVRDMAEHVRNLYVLALAGDEVELDVSETSRRELAGELQWFGADRASRLLGVLGDLSAELKTSSNPRLSFEIALTRMVRPDSDLTLESLAERVEALESGYSAVAHVLPGQPLASSEEELQAGFERKVVGDIRPATVDDQRQHALEQSDSRARCRSDDSHSDRARSQQAARQDAGSPRDAVSEGDSSGDRSLAGEGGSGNGGQIAAGGASKLSSLSNPASLQRIWSAVLSGVGKEKQAYGVLFMNTKVAFDEAAGELSVMFPAENDFAFKTVQKAEVREILSHVLAKAIGEPVAFRYEKMGNAGEQGSVPVSTNDHLTGVGARDVRTGQAHPSAQTRQDQRPAEQPRSQAQSQQQVQQPQPQALVQQPQAQESQPKVQQPQSEHASQFGPSGQPADRANQPTYEQVPYEEVPYEEVPYEQVPYEEFDIALPEPDSHPSASQGWDAMPEPAPAPRSDASSAPSPSDNRDENGGFSENPEDLQALLQAGFGADVVLSEVDDE